jgi:hypothetical protein
MMERFECSECGKYPEKLHRRYKGKTYCQACYQRVFKHRHCPECNQFARLPIDMPEAVCKSCERLKPCVRCGGQSEKISKITDIGPVCNKCFPYFVEPKKCTSCGNVSRKYSVIAVLGDVAVFCSHCRPRASFGTCHKCHRYRKLTFNKDLGKGICMLCLDEGLRICEICSQPFPAGYGKVCENCYWIRVFKQRKSVTSHLFATETVKDIFVNFSDWLRERRGPAVAAMQLNKYSQLLYEIERQWGKVPEYRVLVDYFSVAKMRRFKRFFDWLAESGAVQVDKVVKAEDSERHQILKVLDSANTDRKLSSVLSSYYEYLTNPQKEKPLNLRTVRLYLRAATSLVMHSSSKGDVIPRQSDVNSFLTTKPGQQASLSPFIIFLRMKGLCNLTVYRQPKASVIKSDRHQLKKSLFKLLAVAATGDLSVEGEWAALALRYFHGVSKKDCHRILNGAKAIAGDDGVTYVFMKRRIWVPKLPQ